MSYAWASPLNVYKPYAYIIDLYSPLLLDFLLVSQSLWLALRLGVDMKFCILQTLRESYLVLVVANL